MSGWYILINNNKTKIMCFLDGPEGIAKTYY